MRIVFLAPLALALALTLSGCGAGGSAGAPTLAALAAGALAVARTAHPAALLVEARGSAERGHTAADLTRWRFVFSQTARPSADPGVIAVTWSRSGYSAAQEVPIPIDPDLQEALGAAPPMSLEEALRRLRVAGCDAPYASVRCWQPAGASRAEPIFEFAIPRVGGTVAVGAVSGRVSGLPLGGGPESPSRIYYAIYQEIQARFPQSGLLYAVVTFPDDGGADSAPLGWDCVCVNEAANPATRISSTWNPDEGYSGPHEAPHLPEGYTPFAWPEDPITFWQDFAPGHLLLKAIPLRALTRMAVHRPTGQSECVYEYRMQSRTSMRTITIGATSRRVTVRAGK